MYGHFGRFGRFPQIPFWAEVGEIPTSYKVAMSYEEQLLWLCHQVELLSKNNPNVSYNALQDKPSINGVELIGNLSDVQLGLQHKLIPRR